VGGIALGQKSSGMKNGENGSCYKKNLGVGGCKNEEEKYHNYHNNEREVAE
jgi:hypothetical protein